MAPVTSKEDNDWIAEFGWKDATRSGQVLIGGKRASKDKNAPWYWKIDNCIFEYTNWAPGEPRGSFDGFNIALYINKDVGSNFGKWNDLGEDKTPVLCMKYKQGVQKEVAKCKKKYRKEDTDEWKEGTKSAIGMILTNTKFI
jgi:hypothetical protein